jgi:DNA-binding MarR family transcriptional regulator
MRLQPRKKSPPVAAAQVTPVDTRYLESLMGYNCRRAAVSIIGLFLDRMAVYGIKPVDFSVLSLICHNPGITSRQLCKTLDLLPPSLVGIINNFENRGLISRNQNQQDRRAIGLDLTEQGRLFMADAEKTVSQLELDASNRLTVNQRRTLITLLQRIYRDKSEGA